jgi:hypothetical protein
MLIVPEQFSFPDVHYRVYKTPAVISSYPDQALLVSLQYPSKCGRPRGEYYAVT